MSALALSRRTSATRTARKGCGNWAAADTRARRSRRRPVAGSGAMSGPAHLLSPPAVSVGCRQLKRPSAQGGLRTCTAVAVRLSGHLDSVLFLGLVFSTVQDRDQ